MSKEQEKPEIVVLKIKQDDLLDAMTNIEAIKPAIQRQILLGNRKMGSSKEQTAQDIKDFGKHIDTAITAMTMIYGLMEENSLEEIAATKKGGTGEWIKF
jgi:hypothetical protein